MSGETNLGQELGQKDRLGQRLKKFGRAFKELVAPNDPAKEMQEALERKYRLYGENLQSCQTLQEALVVLKLVQDANKSGNGIDLGNSQRAKVEYLIYPGINGHYSIQSLINAIESITVDKEHVPTSEISRPIRELAKAYYIQQSGGYAQR